MEKPPKQTMVIRKDLNMRRGKQIAQGSHASGKVFFDRIDPRSFTLDEDTGLYSCVISNITPDMKEWLDGQFTKIALSCNSEEEIYELERVAKENNIPCAVIVDSGKTELNGIPTNTCIALGPGNAKKIEEITRRFTLL